MKRPSIVSRGRPDTILSVRELTLRFGGIVALDAVSFDLREGQILGLIGPNGAGKTSLFNCVSRLYVPSGGDILFNGKSLLEVSPHQIATAGIARTFQNVALFPTMSVLDNIMVGAHSRTRGDYLSDALSLSGARRTEEELRSKAMQLIRELELDELASKPAGDLPFGSQKRVELARALASNPTLLLLDEPAGGLTHSEVKEFGHLVCRIRDERKLSVMLVEHHMGLVMSISDHVVALDFGRRIAEGPPREIQNDANLIRAYLGGVAS
jgi:branched-chain amino acid transport system ATP-binding protein